MTVDLSGSTQDAGYGNYGAQDYKKNDKAVLYNNRSCTPPPSGDISGCCYVNRHGEGEIFLNQAIDEPSSQGRSGDCWLLASLNTLSHSEEGRKVIDDAITINHNDTVTVEFKGVNRSYTITKDELLNARFGMNNHIYSTGDDDMLLFELATDKLYVDYANGEFNFDSEILEGLDWETQEDINEDINNGFGYEMSSLYAGVSNQFLHILTGKKVDRYVFAQLRDFDIADKFNEGKIYTTDFKHDETITDVNGKEVKLHNNHAYSVIDITDDTVSVINPWDSNDIITMPKQTYLDKVLLVYECDLNGEDANYLAEPAKSNNPAAYANKTYIEEK